jgi:VIT1/CCC1 family predicted Fe2+/Mn2+ transporter
MSEDELAELTNGRLNWLRAGVLGANDGIVSVAAVVIGVAGASLSNQALLLAGLAALIGGAFSMALGEYVSVSSQRDSQRAANGGKAASRQEASPWVAAFASAVSFLSGGCVPVLTVVLLPEFLKVGGTTVAVVLTLMLAGFISARVGGSHPVRATMRMVLGGLLALGATFLIGSLFGTVQL